MKMINLGAGSNILPPPWENYDADLDITKPLPFANDSVDRILIEHCMEHVSMGDALRFLIEAHRVLKNAGEPYGSRMLQSGVLRVCVPSIEDLSVEHGRDIAWNHGHEGVYTKTSLYHMLRLAGFSPSAIRFTDRGPEDGHHHVIGVEKDDLETIRAEAIKL